jgi:hypothetical protein
MKWIKIFYHEYKKVPMETERSRRKEIEKTDRRGNGVGVGRSLVPIVFLLNLLPVQGFFSHK